MFFFINGWPGRWFITEDYFDFRIQAASECICVFAGGLRGLEPPPLYRKSPKHKSVADIC